MRDESRISCRQNLPSVVHFDESGFCARSLRYPAGTRQGNHAHNDLTITLIARGRVREKSEFGTMRAGIANVVVKPWGIAHANVYGPNGLDTLQLRVSRDAIPTAIGLSSYAWYSGGPLVRAMFALFRACRERVPMDSHECYAHTLRILDGVVSASTAKCTAAPPPWLARIVADLERSFTSPASTSRIAREANRHRVSVARVFRRHYRCSITDYIRRKRVLAACKAIETDDRSLADIAMDVGFADQPHLNRAFQRELGIAPGQLRRLIQ